MLFKLFTTFSPAKFATTTQAGSKPQQASPPRVPISKPSILRGILQKLRRSAVQPKNAHYHHPQDPSVLDCLRLTNSSPSVVQAASTHPQEGNNIPGFATPLTAQLPMVPAINPTQLTPPPSVAASWVSDKSESPDPSIDRPNAHTRRGSGRSWSSSWFEFERITARSEPQRGGSAWQGPSDVSEVEETCSEESGEGNRASGRSWSSSWYEFKRIPAGSDPQRAGSAWQALSDVSEGEATCSDSEFGEHSRASTDASASFQWSNEGLAWVNSGSSSLSPSPSAGSLRPMPRGRQGGRMYAMRVPSAYGSDTDEDDFMDYLLR